MTDWQPIDTAPVDQNILVWLPAFDQDGREHSVWPAIVTEDGEDGRWIDIPDWSEGGVGYSVGKVDPRYWMPAPQPPSTDRPAA